MQTQTDAIGHYASPLGAITMASDGTALTGLWFDGQKYFGATLSADAAERDLPVFAQASRWLDLYFAGSPPPFTPPIVLRTTPFRQRVCRFLMGIPYGETMTYGAVAAALGVGSARAVGGAVGRNPISLIVPCHRVVGADGRLTGYAGGTDRKAALLAAEAGFERSIYERQSNEAHGSARTHPKEEPI